MRPSVAGFGFPTRRSPATIGLLAALAGFFVLAWLGLRGVLVPLMTLQPSSWLGNPWTLITYPFASLGNGGDLFFFLILLYWLYNIGSQIESEIGAKAFLGWFFGLAVLGGLAIGLGGMALRVDTALFGPGLPTAGLTVLWAARNPLNTVMVFFVLPLQARWLAIVTGLFVIFGYGTPVPMLGVIAALPLFLAWFVGGGQVAIPKVGPKSDAALKKRQDAGFDNFIDAVRTREKEREERERLRKLFEESLDDDKGR